MAAPEELFSATVGGALALLPLFLSMRAAIRANVLLTRQRQCSQHGTIAADAIGYFDLARQLLSARAPFMLAVGGKSGTGKSVLARDIAGLIAQPPGALVLRSDVSRKQRRCVGEYTKLPRATYTAETSARVYEAMIERAERALAQGISVVLDAAFLKPQERDAAATAARAAGAGFRGIFLSADSVTRRRRIAFRQQDASDATTDVVLAQESMDVGRNDWDIVDASGSPAATLERSISRLPATSLHQGGRKTA